MSFAKNLLASTGVGSVLGIESSAEKAADAAALAQEEASKSGIGELKRQFDVTQAGIAPFQEAGTRAIEQQQALTGLLGDQQQQAALSAIQQSPGQQFLQRRAQKSLLSGAAAAGQRLSGNVLTALQEQGIGFAQQDLQNQFGRLGQIAGQGQQAATNIGQFGTQTAQGIQQGLQQAGQARASGILGGQQAQAQGTNQLLQLGAAFLSDKRLKTNIKDVGSFKGVKWYTWVWNELANELGLFGNDSGVIADEVKISHPHLVKENDQGYLTVIYSGLGV